VKVMTARRPPIARRLRLRLLVAAFAFAASIPQAVALGRAEEEKVQAVVKSSKKWVFFVAAFDTADLPPSQRLIGELSAGRLKRAIEAVEVRKRSREEIETYADYADAEAREAAGKDLGEKRTTRAGLLYDGNADWKYGKELKKADAAVLSAEEKLREVEALRSRVEGEGAVTLSEKNAQGALPPPPKAAEVTLFCRENGLDALLTGSVEPYYGRMRLRMQLYSRFLRTGMYEDEVIFSSEDRETAFAELEGRLSAFIGGAVPAALSISTEPQEADIVVDGKLIGHGYVGPMEKRPAPTKIEASAPLYESAELTVELASDEHSKVSIALKPLEMEELEIEAVGTAEAKDVAVRLGALYAGNVPLVLSLPSGEMSYITVETGDGLGASAVVAEGGRLVLELKPLPGPAAKPVEKARRGFYGAFGRFSIALPIAFFMSGLALVYENAAIWSGDADMQEKGESTRSIANAAVTVAVCFFAEAAVRFGFYIHAANERATSLVRPQRQTERQRDAQKVGQSPEKGR